MSNFYSTGAQFAFVDSQFGSAATSTGIKVNVPIITDIKYHKKVQVKTLWASHGMISADTYSEGTTEETKPGTPVIRKTDFAVQKGDTIKMHQRTNLAITPSVGIVGATNQIVNAEVGWDLNYKLVKIEQWRQAVLTVDGMNAQRSPFSESFVQTEMDLLSDWTAQVEDTGLLAALHYGWAYHLYRQYGTTNITVTANANTIYGNDTTLTTTNTIANLTGTNSDNISGLTFELIQNYMTRIFADPVMVEGDPYWVVLISSDGKRFLYRDPEFRNAVQLGRERGLDNPLFKYGNPLIYGNCAIFVYEKVRSVIGGNNPAGLTVSNAGAYNSSVTEAVYTGIGGGVAATSLHHTYALGANALALAEGRMRMGERKEDDYGQFIGRDADNIWGATRMDWLDATGAASNNVSSAVFVNTLLA